MHPRLPKSRVITLLTHNIESLTISKWLPSSSRYFSEALVEHSLRVELVGVLAKNCGIPSAFREERSDFRIPWKDIFSTKHYRLLRGFGTDCEAGRGGRETKGLAQDSFDVRKLAHVLELHGSRSNDIVDLLLGLVQCFRVLEQVVNREREQS